MCKHPNTFIPLIYRYFYFASNDAINSFQIHPFRPLPRVNLPFADPHQYSSCVLVVERLFFIERSGTWVADGAYLTDWRNLGTAPPEYVHEDMSSNDGRGKTTISALSDSISLLGAMSKRGERGSRPPRVPDRQYIHRTGYAAVRLGPQGFIWMPNLAPRASESITTVEEKREIANSTLSELDAFCEKCGICFMILIDVIERSVLK